MRRESGVGDDDLVAGIDEHVKERVQPLHVAGGDQHVAVALDLYPGRCKMLPHNEIA